MSRVIILFFVSLGLVNPALADVRADLKKGKIIEASIPGSGVWPGMAMGVVDAPADLVYKIITDFANYKGLLPHVIVDSKKITATEYMLKGKFAWPVNDAYIKVKIKRARKGKTLIVQWKMTQGTFKEYSGTAWVQPYGKNKSVLTYKMLAVPTIFAPSAIMTHGLKKATTAVIEAVRNRVSLLSTSSSHVKTAAVL
jgi:hypothetical protein